MKPDKHKLHQKSGCEFLETKEQLKMKAKGQPREGIISVKVQDHGEKERERFDSSWKADVEARVKS